MKKIIILFFGILVTTIINAQDFGKDISTAKSSYSAGKLEDAHFALQQSLQELDIIIGKEVIKSLPAKMNDLQANASDDNVSGNVSFVGATIHRSYGTADRKAEIDIVNNSPMVTALNAFLTTPLLAGLGSDGKSKVIKVQGYKGRITREDNSNGDKPGYTLEMPFNNALLTFKVDKSSDDEITAMANTLPLAQIAKLIQ